MKNISMYNDNNCAVINTEGMEGKKLLTIFDMMFNAEESEISDEFDAFIENKKDVLQEQIVEQYDLLVEEVPSVTDGKEMFDFWSYFWFRDSWAQDAQENNRKLIFKRNKRNKKYTVTEIYDNENI